MKKIKAFHILFFMFTIFWLNMGCAKKMETVKSSMGIEDGAVRVPEKDSKDTVALKGTPSVKEDIKGIKEERLPNDAASVEAASDNKKDLNLSEVASKSGTETKPEDGKLSLLPTDINPMEAPNKDIQHAGDEAEQTAKLETGLDKETRLAINNEVFLAKNDTETITNKKISGREDSGLKDIFFVLDGWTIQDELKDILEHNAKYLISNHALQIQIQGHADERGTNEYNLALGERRAKSAAKFLIDLGVDEDRIFFVTLGEERPFCTDHEDFCWSQNRRGHFLVIERQ